MKCRAWDPAAARAHLVPLAGLLRVLTLARHLARVRRAPLVLPREGVRPRVLGLLQHAPAPRLLHVLPLPLEVPAPRVDELRLRSAIWKRCRCALSAGSRQELEQLTKLLQATQIDHLILHLNGFSTISLRTDSLTLQS